MVGHFDISGFLRGRDFGMTRLEDILSVALTKFQGRGDFSVTINPARSLLNFDDFLFLMAA
jgi:hypothetical protein